MEEFDSFFKTLLISYFLISLCVVICFILIRRSKSKNRITLIGWNTLLICWLVLSVGLTGETYYRFYADYTDSFSISKLSKRWMDRHYKSRNNLDFNPFISNNKRRISIIGDSFTKGHGVKNISDTYPKILQDLNKNIEIHTLARNGANSFSESNLLNEVMSSSYELDIVVLAYCLNDIDYFVNETQLIYKRFHHFNAGLSYLEKESYFLNRLAFRLFVIQNPDILEYTNFVLKGYSNSAWKKQENQLIEIKNKIERMNGQLVVVTFPFFQHDSANYKFKEVHNKLDDFWKKQGIPHLDLLQVFEDKLGEELTVNQYDAHPNEKAHRMAADHINQFLQEKNLLK